MALTCKGLEAAAELSGLISHDYYWSSTLCTVKYMWTVFGINFTSTCHGSQGKTRG